ncbi:MAG: NAD/NADP octopine/nopaline dehydrogenase family protein [Anaerolineae bacterium]|nr:NAD/NADP octopine/nopaline dehydrogenase family protein [Anaerolineae bacterium]
MSSIEHILIMGAGPGGMAAAAALANRGYQVNLYNRSPERLAPLIELGGIEIEGDLGEKVVPLARITTDIAEAAENAQLILIAVPGYGQRGMVEALLPFLKSGQTILLLTGSAGSLEVAPLIQSTGYTLDDILLGETVTLPQSARMVGPAKLRVRLPSLLRFAAFPGRNTQRLMETIGDTLRLKPTTSVLDPGLNNPNFMIHPAPMLLNYAAVERANGMLSIMNEGMTKGVLRCLDAVDAEKMALQQALGLEVVTIDDLYTQSGSGPHVYRHEGEPFGLRDRIWDRYIYEDVPYGTVLYSSLGHMIGVPTPISDGINHILSVVEQTDFWASGRTVESLGIAGMTRAQLVYYLETGEKNGKGTGR